MLLSSLALMAALAPVAAAQAPAGGPDEGTAGAPSLTPTAPAPAAAAYGTTMSRRTNFRSRPTSGSAQLARLPQGTRVRVTCQRMSSIAPGRSGRSRIWDRVVLPNGKRAWVADGLLNTGSELLVAKVCGDPAYAPAASGATSGQCPVGTPVKLLKPFGRTEDLIDAALPGARASLRKYRVPVAMTLAQTILETGGGRSPPAPTTTSGSRRAPRVPAACTRGGRTRAAAC